MSGLYFNGTYFISASLFLAVKILGRCFSSRPPLKNRPAKISCRRSASRNSSPVCCLKNRILFISGGYYFLCRFAFAAKNKNYSPLLQLFSAIKLFFLLFCRAENKSGGIYFIIRGPDLFVSASIILARD